MSVVGGQEIIHAQSAICRSNFGSYRYTIHDSIKWYRYDIDVRLSYVLEFDKQKKIRVVKDFYDLLLHRKLIDVRMYLHRCRPSSIVLFSLDEIILSQLNISISYLSIHVRTIVNKTFKKMMFQKSLIAMMAITSAAAFAPQSPAFVGRRAATTSLSMASSEELTAKVKGIIVSQLGVDAEKVVPAATFVDDLGADSLDTVELIMAIEEEFDCEIPEEEAANISTVQEVIDYVSKL